jgi:uncharacterized membrane protein
MGWPWVMPLMFFALVVGVAVVGLLVIASGHARLPSERRPRSPETMLRDRYVRGELDQRQYHEALVDVLKDYYVRGRLGLEEYEARLKVLFGNERKRRADAQSVGPSRGTESSGPIAQG